MALDINRVKYNDSWPLVRLKEACNRISDGTHFTPEYVKEGTPFISVKDIYGNKVHFGKCKYITPEAHKELTKRCHPEKDDILITKSGTIGRMALVPEKPEFSLFVSVALIKNKREILDSKFLKFCLENFINSIDIAQDIKGGLLKNFHLEDIRETLVPIVPLPVQHAIVTKIEEIFSELDHGVEQLKTAQQQLKVYRQAVLKWAFEGRLTNEEVVDGELPDGWKEIRLGEVILDIEAGKSLKCDERPPNETEIGIVKVSAVTWGTYDELESKTCYSMDSYNADYLIREGDFLFSRANTLELVGACVIVHRVSKRLMLSDKILRFYFSDKILKQFVLYYLRSQKGRYEIEQKSSGNQMSMRNIGQGRIREIEIPLPPFPEQHQIVSEIERRLSVCDKLEETIEAGLKQAEVLRAGVLKMAFEGRLVGS